jgi:hypothetical protein
MNYTESQIKLAGLVQPDGGAREFEQGLDLQGEGIRVLQNSSTIFEENTGDCCEDLQTCEIAAGACEAEKEELEEENQDLQDENDILDVIAGQASYYASGSCTHPHTPQFTCFGVVNTIQVYTSWLEGSGSSKWLFESVNTNSYPTPSTCYIGDGWFVVRRVSNGFEQAINGAKNTRKIENIALQVGEVYEVYSRFTNWGSNTDPACDTKILLGSFTATSNGPVPIE